MIIIPKKKTPLKGKKIESFVINRIWKITQIERKPNNSIGMKSRYIYHFKYRGPGGSGFSTIRANNLKGFKETLKINLKGRK